ncbi:MAG TPA: TadE/TadG family type IV pilus assembly protein [Anaerolineae bacterium]|nr:TadE/TadG family type IV pilus assembly protein [Anaerolineae bacterium]HQI85904.1 TadE/TadG family type IV pilus assembly protein [Anaerolineae bacterium]
MKYKRSNKSNRGQSLVEVALVLPIILMILLGLLDFGRAYFTLVALHDAADEGATYAAIRPSDVAGIQRRAAEASTRLVPIQQANVSVVYPPIITVGAPITVTIDYFLDLYTPFVQAMLPDGELILMGSATQPIITVR